MSNVLDRTIGITLTLEQDRALRRVANDLCDPIHTVTPHILIAHFLGEKLPSLFNSLSNPHGDEAHLHRVAMRRNAALVKRAFRTIILPTEQFGQISHIAKAQGREVSDILSYIIGDGITALSDELGNRSDVSLKAAARTKIFGPG